MLLAVLLMLPIQTMVFAEEASGDIVIVYADAEETPAETEIEEEIEESAEIEAEEELPEQVPPEDEEDDEDEDSLAAGTSLNVNDSPVAPTSVATGAALADAVAAADGEVTIMIEGGELILAQPLEITGSVNLTIGSQGDAPAVVKASGSRHIEINVTGGNVTLDFENVVLDGGGTGGGIEAYLYDGSTLTVNNAVVRNAGTSDSYGGGMSVKVHHASVVINDSEFTGNTAEEGGALYFSGYYLNGEYATIDVEINNTRMVNNTSNRAGAGLSYGFVADDTKLAINNSVISDNTSRIAVGGGVSIQGVGVLEINDTEINNNTKTSSGNGGGIYISRADDVAITGGSISGNSTASSGGGLYVAGAYNSGNPTTVTLSGVEIKDNLATANTSGAGGGVHIHQYSNLLIEDCVISGNQARSTGGGIRYNNVGNNNSIRIVNSEITNNSGSNGGGLHVGANNTAQLIPVVITDSVFSGNVSTGTSASSGGGGVYVYNAARHLLEIRGESRFSDNVANQGYYLEDAEHAALHAQNIDRSVTFHEDHYYIYNNHDVFYTSGSTEPVAPVEPENYTFQIITEVFEYGQDVIAVAIDTGSEVDASTVSAADYTVSTSNLNPNSGAAVYEGARAVTGAYVSNVENVGSPAESGRYIILELEHGYNLGGASTLIYTGGRNLLLVMNYEVSRAGSADSYEKVGEINLIVDDFAYGDEDGLLYRLYSPDSEEALPLVIWTHGGGESGNNNESQLRANMGGTAWASPENQAERPAYVLAPQTSSSWSNDDFAKMRAVIDELIADGKVDADRVYISGCSMGGGGAWRFMLQNADLIAAAVPICPVYTPTVADVETVLDIPLWLFHAAGDRTVSVNNSRTAFERLTAGGHGNVQYTELEAVTGIDGYEYPDSHWSWVNVLNNHDNVMNWLFEQVRSETPAPSGKIVNEETLREAIEAGLASGEAFELPIAVNEITLTEAIALTQGADITFTVDANPVEEINGDVVLKTDGVRHITFNLTGGDLTLRFDGVVLDGEGVEGGIQGYIYADSLTINDAVIQNCYNSALNNNGALSLRIADAVVNVNGGTLQENRIRPALDAQTLGSNYGPGRLNITGTRFLNNNAGANNSGGAFTFNNNTANATAESLALYVKDAVFEGNSSQVHGGVAYIGGAGQFVFDGIVANGNSASNGGFIQVGNAASTKANYRIIDSTITNNTARTNGGAIYFNHVANGLPNLEIRGNTVFSGNTARQGYYLTNDTYKAHHAANVDSTVTWDEPYRYIYNNNDVQIGTADGTDVPPESYNFQIITEVFEYGQDVIAVAIDTGSEVDGSTVSAADYTVSTTNLNPNNGAVVYQGARAVTNAYVSNVENVGSPAESGRYIILELEHGFNLGGASTLIYTGGRNLLLVMNYEVSRAGSADSYEKTGEINLIVDDFAYGDEDGLLYRLYSPDSDEALPLVIWTHGSGESGNNNESQIRANMGGTAWASPENQAERAAYVLAPQTSSGWSNDDFAKMRAVIDGMIADGKVDADRVYISGCSMGGGGTWRFVLQNTDLIAAAIPICPVYTPTAADVEAVLDIPLWLFHAAGDRSVSVNNSRTAYERLTAGGHGNVQYTELEAVTGINGYEYPDSHWSWVNVLNNHDNVMNWLFEQVRSEAAFKIVDEATLREAIEAGLASGEAFELPIAVNEITLSAAIALAQDADITFTVDAEPVEEIDGDVTIYAPGARHMTIASGTTASLAFDGVVFDGQGTGGGITANGATLKVVDAQFSNCYVAGSGGAISAGTGANLTVENSRFVGNAASGSGGAINTVTNTVVTISNSLFENNRALGGSTHSAGALFVGNSTTATVTNSRFVGNAVPNAVNGGGGAIRTTSNFSLRITGCEFEENTTAGQGGAVFSSGNTGSSLRITGSTFAGNSAASGGAVSGTLTGPIVIADSTFADNSAADGGAIDMMNLTFLQVRGSTAFTGNTASNGGRYVNSASDIALHAQRIDPSVTWTSGYPHLYNNHDVAYTEGSPDPIEVDSVAINSSALTIVRKGAVFTLEAIITPSYATDPTVTWTSSNTNIATVDAVTGEVKVVGQGMCQIIATSANGKTATIYISAS